MAEPAPESLVPVDLELADRPQGPPAWLLTTFVAIGLSLRLICYLQGAPLWLDEAYLAASLLDRNYVELLKPLDYDQVCPVLFLFVELTVVRTLGYCEATLRLFPMLCGLASVLVFARVTGRLLKGWPAALAVGVFAVSPYLVRFSGEVKPYSCDLLVSLVLTWCLVEWRAQPQRTRWLWALAAIAPFAVFLSYTSVFVGGGLGLVAGFWTLRSRRLVDWAACAAFGLTLVGSFAAYQAMIANGIIQHVGKEHVYIFWSENFPPLTNPLGFVVWFFRAHCGSMFAYPLGFEDGGSTFTFLACCIALRQLIKARQWTLVGICCGPFAVTFLAAALHRYPYGGNPRVEQHVPPFICLLTGAGVAIALAQLAAWRRSRAAETPAVRSPLWGWGYACLLGAVGVGLLVSSLVRPYRSQVALEFRDFSRWYYPAMCHDAELICVAEDLREPFALQPRYSEIGALYRVNYRIYRPARPQGDQPLTRVTAVHPLRCVLFHGHHTNDEPQVAAWLSRITAQFDLKSRSQLLFHEGKKPRPDRVEIFEFVPRTTSTVIATVPADGPH